ncbi:Pyrophosphatase PpaX [Clostridium felsineum]|nr:Pyrophosphatase PpaX [Clostridium felsineum]
MIKIIKAVIFDLDDTLYNEMDFVKEGFKCVASFLSRKYHLDEKKLFEDILEILKLKGRGKIFDTLCKKYNIKEDIKTLVEIYRKTSSPLQIYDDAKEVLESFNGKYKMGVITDGKASVQWNKINNLGIEKYFDKIIVTDDFGEKFWKPSEFAFIEMIKFLGCKACEAVYVGDNPRKDFIGARKVGLYTVRIIREQGDNMCLEAEHGYEAHNSINNLMELSSIIKNI